MGTQTIPAGGGIPMHLHEAQAEVLFIHLGRGTVVIEENPVSVEPGSTVYLPAGAWHALENPGPSDLVLVWVISPPGLEGMFREIGSPVGEKALPLSRAEFEVIAGRHGVRVRPAGSPPESEQSG